METNTLETRLLQTANKQNVGTNEGRKHSTRPCSQRAACAAADPPSGQARRARCRRNAPRSEGRESCSAAGRTCTKRHSHCKRPSAAASTSVYVTSRSRICSSASKREVPISDAVEAYACLKSLLNCALTLSVHLFCKLPDLCWHAATE